MRPVAVIAAGAVSALGSGVEAYDSGRVGEKARSAIAHDPELERAGLRHTLSGRVHQPLPGGADRAESLLLAAAKGLAAALEAALPDFRSRKIALAIGTSGGGLPSLERALELRADGAAIPEKLARSSFYSGALDALRRELGIEPVEERLVLSACSSSTVALGLGARLLESGRVDLVIAGGFDALTIFIAAGFESLRATSQALPQPFRVGREGMALGEGAALVALARSGESPPGDQRASGSSEEDEARHRTAPLGYVLGFGASSDAVHITAPDRTGSGVARAAERALADAGLPPSRVDLVSAHATATPYNDAAEANAIELVLGAAAERAVVQPFKAVIGHTLGAAGALESLSALRSLGSAILPAAPGTGAVEPHLRARLLDRNTAGNPAFALKLSSAFGGANAALVLGTRRPERSPLRSPRAVRLELVGTPCFDLDEAALAERLGVDPLRIARLDPLSRLGVAASANVLASRDAALPEGAGVVVGSMGATLDRNEVHHARLRERGTRGAEPRRFPSTSPNLVAGECSILFGLKGPAFAVGGGPSAALEALLTGYDLVEAGDAPAILVIAVEEAGAVVTELSAAAGLLAPVPGALAVLLTACEESTPGEPRLDRIALAELELESRRAGGRSGGAAPGYPSLLEGLARLSSRLA